MSGYASCLEIPATGDYYAFMFRKSPLSFYSVIAVLAVLASVPAGALDPLWEKALEHAAPEDTEVLIGMRMEGVQFNKSGEVTKTSTMVMEVDSQTGEMMIVSAVENDKDVTDKRRRQAERDSDEENGDEEYVHGIFNPEKAGGLTLESAGFEAVVHGRDCAAYSFRLEDERKMGPGNPKYFVEEGVVFLDMETGMPLRLQSRMVDGPNSINRMTYTMNAVTGPDGTWRPAHVDMEFAGRMVVYMAGEFTMHFIYSDM